MEKKVFKSYRQLISLLRNRGINIKKGSAGSRVIRILEKENYYNVINGYKELFIDRSASNFNQEVYKPGTKFDEIYALYTFDREIRIIYLKYILKLENHFKSIVSHHFSKKYGYDNYLKIDNFHCTASNSVSELKKIAKRYNLDLINDISEIKRISQEENVANITRLIGDIHQEIARQLNKHHPMVTHYMIKHGYIPLWVLVNVLTFGKVTTFYLYMKDDDKIEIARQFHINYIELHKYMSILGFARNKCAHDERFFDIRFKQLIHTRSIPYFSSLNLPRNASGSYTKGLCDLYAIVIIFRQLLSKQDLNEFISALELEIKKLSKQLKTISVNDVLDVMGFPDNWKNILITIKKVVRKFYSDYIFSSYYTLFMYSPVLVSILILSPMFTNKGTCTTAPVSTVAGFEAPVAVSSLNTVSV